MWTLVHRKHINWMKPKECIWIVGSCLNDYTCFILLDLWDHTDLSQALLCILQCRVACLCVCVCVCTASLEMASQTGRQIQSISMLFKFNFLHTMIEFKTFLALCILISKTFHQILTTISFPYFYKGCAKILLTIQ